MIDVTLDDGTEIVRDGVVVPGDPVVLATANFTAGGGDCYELGDIESTSVGVTYQLALANYIEQSLGGTISADQYPEADTRISFVSFGAVEAPAEAPEAPTELPNTGSTSAPLVIFGSAVLAAGAMFTFESRRARR